MSSPATQPRRGFDHGGQALATQSVMCIRFENQPMIERHLAAQNSIKAFTPKNIRTAPSFRPWVSCLK
ncbi:hypothetical protein CHELA20_10317 [Hyphomicrobiales bacterium]|nr:hypothetical protein CHELA20_10317 [Hyphomicrobiales bacterium]CAH1691583.1 hypothetical protein CHELA41_50544 [Hyphomicrobiales bacterium]